MRDMSLFMVDAGGAATTFAIGMTYLCFPEFAEFALMGHFLLHADLIAILTAPVTCLGGGPLS
jgi:hypothetical protein